MASKQSPDKSVLEKYLEAGFWLIPSYPGGTQAGVKWKEWQNPEVNKHFVKTSEQLAQKLRSGVTVFLIMPQQLGCIGLDLDRGHDETTDGVENLKKMFLDAGQNVPDLVTTPAVSTITGRGGVHLLFKYDGHQNTKTCAAMMSGITNQRYPGVDVRGYQGLLVAAGSCKASGNVYQLHGDLENIPHIPQSLITHLPTRTSSKKKAAGPIATGALPFLTALRESYRMGRMERDLTDGEANKNDNLFWYICKCLEKGISRDEIEAVVYAEFPIYCEVKGRGHIGSNLDSAERTVAEHREQSRSDFNKRIPDCEWYPDHISMHYNDTTGENEISVQPTLENFKRMLSWYRIDVKENLLTHELEITIPGQSAKEGKKMNAALGVIESLCTVNNLAAKNSIQSYLLTMGFENQYHPVRDWFETLEWDGTDRFADLLQTLTHAPDYSATLKEKLLKAWLVSCVAAIYEDHFHTRLVLTLQGPQSMGKTSWLRSLMPEKTWFKDGLNLDPRNKDTIEVAISHWVAELGELEGVFKRSDNAVLKNWITSDRDVVRFAYERRSESYPRRTVLCASVNQAKFLTDSTGSTRFGVIPVIGVNYLHEINIPQLWAQVAIWYRDGAIWWLPPDVEAVLSDSNRDHEEIDEIEEMILAHFDSNEPRNNFMSCSEVAQVMGIERPRRSDLNRISHFLERHGYAKHRSASKRGFLVPDCIDSSVERHKGSDF